MVDIPGGEVHLAPGADQVRRIDRPVLALIDVFDQRGAGLGAVGAPQLVSVDAVVGGEVEEPIVRSVHSLGGGSDEGDGRPAAIGPGIDVLDHRRARGRAIAGPPFPAVRGVAGLEEQLVADHREITRGRPIHVETLDQLRALGRAVAFPELAVAVEQQRVAEDRELRDAALEGPHRVGSLGRAVGLPELPVLGFAVDPEIQLPVHLGQVAQHDVSVAEVAHDRGAGLGPIGLPDLRAVLAVVGHEIDLAAGPGQVQG